MVLLLNLLNGGIFIKPATNYVLCNIYKNEILTSPNVIEIEDLLGDYEHDRMKLFNYSI